MFKIIDVPSDPDYVDDSEEKAREVEDNPIPPSEDAKHYVNPKYTLEKLLKMQEESLKNINNTKVDYSSSETIMKA